MTIAMVLLGLVVIAIQDGIASFINAVFIRIGTKWACGFTPGYWMAYKASFVGLIGTTLVGMVLIPAVVFVSDPDMGLLIPSLLAAPMLLLVQPMIWGKIIKRSEADPIGIASACLVALAVLGITLGITIPLALVFLLVGSAGA